MSLRRIVAVVGSLGVLLVLGTFRLLSPEEVQPETQPAPVSVYRFDPASGETRASARAADGAVTTLQSGKSVPLRLPAGFSLFPGVEVVEHNRVERGAGHRSLVVMTSKRPVAEIAAFYRGQARSAGVELLVDFGTSSTATLAGRAADGIDFAFTARQDGDRTRAQLAVGQGL